MYIKVVCTTTYLLYLIYTTYLYKLQPNNNTHY